MQSRKKFVFARGLSKGNRVDRRRFLTGLAALGGAANLLSAAEPARSSGPAAGGRGKVQDVRGEIKEYKDPKTVFASVASPATAPATSTLILLPGPSWAVTPTIPFSFPTALVRTSGTC